MKKDWIFVNTDEKLKSSMKDAGASPLIGLDTEYDSFRYFREKLCLIQIDTQARTYIYDPLGDIDFSCLGDILKDPTITKIIHASGNDIRFLNRDYGYQFHNIFDTHKAASLLGTQSLSLPSVIQEYLGIAITKTKKLQRSRWDIRPLSEEQLHYAARDTQYLMDLYRALKEKLEAANLVADAETAFSQIAASRWNEKTFHPKAYLKIEGCEDLEDHQQERLKNLYLWRFEKAKETNRARFMILANHQMVALSKEKAFSIDSLKETGIIAARPLNEWGEEIIEILNRLPEASP